MGHTIVPIDDQYDIRDGLEGPFRYRNGRVLYYDVKEGKYWDPKTDFYVGSEEIVELLSHR